MTKDLTNDSGREQQLNEVLLAYVEEAQAGRPTGASCWRRTPTSAPT